LTEPVFTSAGVSARIELAVCILSHFLGTDVGMATARHIEYPYHKQIREDSRFLFGILYSRAVFVMILIV
jgi:transcriptional regulator GlxA family with amidase domain